MVEAQEHGDRQHPPGHDDVPPPPSEHQEVGRRHGSPLRQWCHALAMRATIVGSEFSARLGDKRMLMSDITSAVRRRWVLAVVCLALILLATVAAVQRSGPTYQSHATVLLVPPHIPRSQPTSGPDYTQGNPLFYLGALEQTRDVLIGSLTSRRTQAEVVRRFPGSSYDVAPDLLNSAAVVELTVE